MAPKGSPIANRLARPATPAWTTLTPAQKAIKVRQPPLPTSHHIAQHVVKGHVKKSQGPRDLPSHTQGRTETPQGSCGYRATMTQLTGIGVAQQKLHTPNVS